MKSMFQSWSPGTIFPTTLIASALVGLTLVTGMLLIEGEPEADMYLSSTTIAHRVGETFSLDVVVHSSVPVNVFAGDVVYNPQLLQIRSIDYNTSIADLWAEKPWYENGDGTLNFAGGTTRPGGFTGDEKLITVTFEAVGPGRATVAITEPRILHHDGIGTDATLRTSIDALIELSENNLVGKGDTHSTIPLIIVKKDRTTDLNGDGEQSLGDMSAFMVLMAKNDIRGDLNGDGSVNIKDLSLLMGSK